MWLRISMKIYFFYKKILRNIISFIRERKEIVKGN